MWGLSGLGGGGTVAPLSGTVWNVIPLSCSDSETSDDDVLSVGSLVPMNRPDVCCARLNDFDWVVPDYVPDILLSGRDIDVELTDLTRDIHVLPDVFPTGRLLCRCPCLIPQVEIRRGTTPAVFPFAEGMTLHVATVGLSDDGSDRPAELLNSESDCCFMDDGVLVPERFPVVSARSAAVPTSLPTISEGFSFAVLVGGSLLRQPP